MHSSGALPFVTGSVLLGTIGIFVQESQADPMTATWFRCAFGLLGLTAWGLLQRPSLPLRLPRRTWPPVLAAGLLLVAGWALFFAAIQRTSIGVATVLFHVQPLWVVVLGAWWLKESPAPHRIGSVAIAMVGLLLATGLVDPMAWRRAGTGEPLARGYWIGVLLCIAGAFCTAWVTVLARQLRALPAGQLAWCQCAIGAVVLAAWPAMNGWPAWGVSWAWLAGLGLIHTGLAYGLMYAGMARLDTDRIAVFQFIYPAVALAADWLVYGHGLGAVQFAGIAVMAAAIWYAERTPRGARRRQATT